MTSSRDNVTTSQRHKGRPSMQTQLYRHFDAAGRLILITIATLTNLSCAHSQAITPPIVLHCQGVILNNDNTSWEIDVETVIDKTEIRTSLPLSSMEFRVTDTDYMAMEIYKRIDGGEDVSTIDINRYTMDTKQVRTVKASDGRVLHSISFKGRCIELKRKL